jgi:hypothetical protein
MKNSLSFINKPWGWITLSLILFLSFSIDCFAFNFPAAGWHRGDASFAQENSRAALVKALYSASPNIELDIIDFIDQNGNRVGLASHDYEMKRAAGLKGAFSEQYNDLSKLPKNVANPQLPQEPFLTVIDLFELIKKSFTGSERREQKCRRIWEVGREPNPQIRISKSRFCIFLLSK